MRAQYHDTRGTPNLTLDYGVCAVVLPHTHLCTAVARTDGLGWGVVALVVLYTAEMMAAVDVVAVAEERASSRKKHAAREAVLS